jgi:hypothetical protein
MNTLMRWWLFMCLSVVGLTVAGVFGFFQFMLRIDHSYLGFVVIAIYMFTSVWIGLMTYHARNGDQLFTRHLHTCRFLSETLMGLGMVGTLIGYLFMVEAMASGAINVADAAAAQGTIMKLANGLGTSSIVTLVGLVGAIGIKAQVANIEYLLEENDAA